MSDGSSDEEEEEIKALMRKRGEEFGITLEVENLELEVNEEPAAEIGGVDLPSIGELESKATLEFKKFKEMQEVERQEAGKESKLLESSSGSNEGRKILHVAAAASDNLSIDVSELDDLDRQKMLEETNGGKRKFALPEYNWHVPLTLLDVRDKANASQQQKKGSKKDVKKMKKERSSKSARECAFD